MSDGWSEFLERAGCRTRERDGVPVIEVADVGAAAAAAAEESVVCGLALRAVVAVSGDEAREFLQSQFTNDLQDITEREAGLGAYCNVKGRVIAVFRVLFTGERWLLVMPQGVVPPLMAKLRLYRMRARAHLDDSGGGLVVLGVAGDAAAASLQERLGSLPGSAGESMHREGLTVVRAEGARLRFEIAASPAAAASIWRALAKCVAVGDDGAWSLTEIRARVAMIDAASSEAFLPQMLDLERLGAVSYTKGCFPGQEVVARTHHLGRVKRVLRRAESADPVDRLRPGGVLRAVSERGERDAGRIIAAATSPSGGSELLAVIPTDAAGSGELRAAGPHGSAVNVVDPVD